MKPACPYCLSINYSKSYMEDNSFNEKIFQYLNCNSCKTIYIYPFPDDNDYLKMYPVEYQGDVFTAPTENYKDLFNLLKKYLPEAKSLLDYGCGNSELLMNAMANNYTVTGVEYNQNFVQKLRELLPNINFHNLNDFYSQNEKYDIIVLNNVLEHVTNPNEVLTFIHSRLSDNGLFVCLGPVENNFNIAHTFRRTIFGLRNMFFKSKTNHCPYHITFTNVKNQKMIFEKNNFKECHFKTGEITWPFPEKVEFNSFKGFVLGLIAQISLKVSKLFSSNAGNLFTYIGRKSN